MLVIRADELEQQGFVCQAASEIVFHNTLFTKSQSFSKEDRQAAINICNNYLKADIVCLIVESQEQLSLWRENKDLNVAGDKIAGSTEKATQYKNTLSASKPGRRSKYIKQPLLK